MMKPVTIFLADLNYVRVGKEWTIIPFPLNMGYIAAFLQKMLPGVLQIKIFKNPINFLGELEITKPDIVAFSNYIWNKNLSLECARYVKETFPECITIMGGPNYNFGEKEWIENFARENPCVDFHIEGEGEVKAFNLIKCCIENAMDLKKIKSVNPAGVTYLDNDGHLCTNRLGDEGVWFSLEGLNIDPKNGRLLNLNDIPSPYLTGVLDDFLNDPNYCPIIETNRGCPYSCTFCNWGDMGKSKSAVFSLDRVSEELAFIAKKNKSKSPYLYVGDANFGLFPRDVEIAVLLRDLKNTYGFPKNVYLYFAKNSTEEVLKIAETLKGMTPISLSRQTQNASVLKNIKRSNISIETFDKLSSLAKSLKIDSYVELIYSLPGESKESFYAGVRSIMDRDVDGLHMFPAMLLNGSEMGTLFSREAYGLKGEFRKIDGCAGEYGPIKAVEYEEIVTTTNCLSRADYFEIRLFHLLQVIFLDTKLYKDVEILLADWTLFDLIQDLIDNKADAPMLFRQLLEQFDQQARDEFVAVPPKTFSSADVEAGLRLVKLNPMYVSKLLYDPGMRDAFHAFLASRIHANCAVPNNKIEKIIEYIDSTIYPFDGTHLKSARLGIDVASLRSRNKNNQVGLEHYLLDEPKEFYFSKEETYADLIEEKYASLPLSGRVYEVILHHSHEKLRSTVCWNESDQVIQNQLATIITDDKANAENERTIQLEGGWLF